MGRITRRLILLLAALVCVVPTPSASATTRGAGVLLANLTVLGGLGFACSRDFSDCPPSPEPSLKSDPKGLPRANVAPGGPTWGFTVSSVACVKDAVKTTKGSPVATGGLVLCQFSAGGVLTGFCDLFTASSIARVVDVTGSFKRTIEVPWKLTSVAGLVYGSGGTAATHLSALMAVQETPTLPGTSCRIGNHSSFALAGSFAFKDLPAT